MNTNKTDITPDTKIADLLLHYPTLEQTLKDYSSAFAALDNPALRDTVAKATSLQQLAKAGGYDIAEMINTLREAVGISSPQSCVCDADEYDGIAVLSTAPTSVTDTIDVRPMIAQGNHPKDIVIKRAAELSKGETLELIAPFVPAPLLDILLGQGFAVSMLPPSTDGTVRAFIRQK